MTNDDDAKAPDRWLVARWPIILGGAALAAQWGYTSNQINVLDSEIARTEARLETGISEVKERFTNIEAELRIVHVEIADNTRSLALGADRITSEVNRSTQADMQMASINSALVTTAQQIATLQEWRANLAQIDNPRLRILEQLIAELKGRQEEMAKSLSSLREYVVRQADARGIRPPNEVRRDQ